MKRDRVVRRGIGMVRRRRRPAQTRILSQPQSLSCASFCADDRVRFLLDGGRPPTFQRPAYRAPPRAQIRSRRRLTRVRLPPWCAQSIRYCVQEVRRLPAPLPPLLRWSRRPADATPCSVRRPATLTAFSRATSPIFLFEHHSQQCAILCADFRIAARAHVRAVT